MHTTTRMNLPHKKNTQQKNTQLYRHLSKLIFNLPNPVPDIDSAVKLIQEGANPNTTNFNGQNLLHIVCTKKPSIMEKYIPLLLELRIDPNTQDRWHRNAFQYLLNSENIPLNLAFLMLKYKANCNTQNNQGDTLLHIIAYSSADIVANYLPLLLACPFDQTILNKKHKNALHYLLNQPNIDLNIAIQMIEKGADINTQNKFGFTILHILLLFCSTDQIIFFISTLMQKKPDLSIRDHVHHKSIYQHLLFRVVPVLKNDKANEFYQPCQILFNIFINPTPISDEEKKNLSQLQAEFNHLIQKIKRFINYMEKGIYPELHVDEIIKLSSSIRKHAEILDFFTKYDFNKKDILMSLYDLMMNKKTHQDNHFIHLSIQYIATNQVLFSFLDKKNELKKLFDEQIELHEQFAGRFLDETIKEVPANESPKQKRNNSKSTSALQQFALTSSQKGKSHYQPLEEEEQDPASHKIHLFNP